MEVTNVDEDVSRLMQQVDDERKEELNHQHELDREYLCQKFSEICYREYRNRRVLKFALKWKNLSSLAKSQREIQVLTRELEDSRLEILQLRRQMKELQKRASENVGKRAHGLDLNELAAQVKELAQELEKTKAENTELKENQRNKISTDENQNYSKQSQVLDSVGSKVIRDYQSKIQRLEEELSREKLKRANETAQKVERETEKLKYKRELDDAKAEIISLQLRLARLETNKAGVNHDPPSSTINALIDNKKSLKVPLAERNQNVKEEEFSNRIPTELDHGENDHGGYDSMLSRPTRKSFFKSKSNSSQITQKNSRPMALIKEEDAVSSSSPGPETCTQQ